MNSEAKSDNHDLQQQQQQQVSTPSSDKGKETKEPQNEAKRARPPSSEAGPAPKQRHDLPSVAAQSPSDWLYQDLSNASASHSPASAPTPTSNLQPLPLPSPYSAPPRAARSPPPAATGGFSLKKLLGARTHSPPRRWIADAFSTEENVLPLPGEKTFEDVVSASIVALADVDQLFAFYFTDLNPMSPVLDPILHTPDYVRRHSAFLYTSIITVAVKECHPALYPACLKYSKALLGQAFEHGISNLELVQAICVWTYWSDVVDDSGPRRFAYAVRCAFELGLHKVGTRALPEDPMLAREILNPERTFIWMTLCDHRFSTLSEKPRMIPSSRYHDAPSWILAHPQTPCPSELVLSPLTDMARLLDLYETLVNTRGEGELPKRQLLDCLEHEVQTWTTLFPLLPAQHAQIRTYAKVFRFQLDEVHLLLAVAEASTSTLPPQDSQRLPLVVFGNCVQAALRIVATGYTESFYMKHNADMWIGIASAAIWLVQNLGGMTSHDRASVMETVSKTQVAAKDLSSSPQQISAYTERLLAHLLKKAQQIGDGGASAVLNRPFLMAAPSAAPGLFSAGAMGLNHAWAGVVQHQQQQPAVDGQMTFFDQMLKPVGSLGEDLVYPPQDDQYWGGGGDRGKRGRIGKEYAGRGRDGDRPGRMREWGPREKTEGDAGEEGEKKERFPKKKVAVLIGYNGGGYSGSQINATIPTIEGEVFKAFVAAGAVSADNADNHQKVGLTRAARTDAGVHAAVNYISLKLIQAPPSLPEGSTIEDHINTFLPAGIRIWKVLGVQGSFSPRMACDQRHYEYTVPTHVFLGPRPGSSLAGWLDKSRAKDGEERTKSAAEVATEEFWKGVASGKGNFGEDLARKRKWRITEGVLESARTFVKAYEGSHNYYNFTVGKDFRDRSCQRVMRSLTITDPFEVNGVEYVSVRFMGQSFMLHQIRKMIGLFILSVRTGTPPTLIPETFGPSRIHIPKAPALGLLLLEPQYLEYNKKVLAGNERIEEQIKSGKVVGEEAKHGIKPILEVTGEVLEKVDKFKAESVYKRMWEVEEEEATFSKWVNYLDVYVGPDFEYLNSKGVIPQAATYKKGENPEKTRATEGAVPAGEDVLAPSDDEGVAGEEEG
ncbi:hypothetical protein MNV49_000887 [Pseudohyphozyma bogoriensis]|nr:hypothetical protein MNV49_000887 [Pseudohyphozyma bogoriensis]